jgi:hypothetical protein
MPIRPVTKVGMVTKFSSRIIGDRRGRRGQRRAEPHTGAIHTVPNTVKSSTSPDCSAGVGAQFTERRWYCGRGYLRAAQEQIDVPGSTGRGSHSGHRLSLRCQFLFKKHAVVAALFGTPVSTGQFGRLVRSRIVTVQGLEHAAKTLRSILASVCQPSSLALHLALLRSSHGSRSRSRLHPLGSQ